MRKPVWLRSLAGRPRCLFGPAGEGLAPPRRAWASNRRPLEPRGAPAAHTHPPERCMLGAVVQAGPPGARGTPGVVVPVATPGGPWRRPGARRAARGAPRWLRAWISTTAARTASSTSPSTSGPSRPCTGGAASLPATSSWGPGERRAGWGGGAGVPAAADRLCAARRRSKHTVVAYRDAIYVFGGDNG